MPRVITIDLGKVNAA